MIQGERETSGGKEVYLRSLAGFGGRQLESHMLAMLTRKEGHGTPYTLIA